MTAPKKDNIYKISSIALLALIASSMIWMNTQFISFVNTNSKEHIKIEKMVNDEINYTHGIYKYEIQPNTTNIKDNQTILKDHEGRIFILEKKIIK